MANEVRQMVVEFVNSSSEEEISVDAIREHFALKGNKFENVDIFSSLKYMEAQNNEQGVPGIVIIGRRGQVTRFSKISKRVVANIPEDKMDKLNAYIDTMEDGQEVLATEICKDVFDGNKIQTIDAFKLCQKSGSGQLIIGRRKQPTRFVKGQRKIVHKNRIIERNITPVQMPKVAFRYNVIGNVICVAVGSNGKFGSVSDAMKECNVDESKYPIQKVSDCLSRFGYFCEKSFDSMTE